jgi:hypothetical protein
MREVRECETPTQSKNPYDSNLIPIAERRFAHSFSKRTP